MIDINIAIDLGKSLVKTLWGFPTVDKKSLLFLEPEIVSLTAEDVASVIRENADPEKDAWLVFPDRTGEALGFVTRTTRYRNRRDIGKDELKSVHGVNRCLSVIGAIAERAALGTNFSVALSVLLPLSEWSTRTTFKQDLLAALESGFNFRGKEYQVVAELLDLKPEGLGLLLRRQLQLPKEFYRTRTILCLVMGHYNNSLYLYQGGQKIASDCSSSGFHQIVDIVVAETALDGSNVASNDLVEGIYQAGSDPSSVKALLWQKVKDAAKLQQQTEQVQQVIEKARADYWKSVSGWIDNCLGANRFKVNEVLISGGASRFFKEEIESFFSDADLLWSCQLNRLVGRDFPIQAESPMAYRLADIYSVFEWLSEISRNPTQVVVGA